MRGYVEWSRLVRRADMMKNITSQFDQSALEQWHYTSFWIAMCQGGTCTRTL